MMIVRRLDGEYAKMTPELKALLVSLTTDPRTQARFLNEEIPCWFEWVVINASPVLVDEFLSIDSMAKLIRALRTSGWGAEDAACFLLQLGDEFRHRAATWPH